MPELGEHIVGMGKPVGRDEALLSNDGLAGGWAEEHGLSGLAQSSSGTSIFDPVLCELCYRWFVPQGGAILDPFAGGSVRGIVASKLGRQYVGIDLSERQINANREQASIICTDPMPVWHVGDSQNISKLAVGYQPDFIFSCPPYYNLELYSHDENDLSNMDYPEFLKAYRNIIAQSVSMLKQDSFACFVVGDVREQKTGYYVGFPSDTIRAFVDAGCRLYNEAILVTAIGSLPIRVTKQFESSRKLGKTHQNVLIFVKGDPRKATEAVGAVDFGDIAENFATVEEEDLSAIEFGEI